MKRYRDTLKKIKEFQERRSRSSILQYKAMMRLSGLSKFIDEGSSTRIWIETIGGQDEKYVAFPNEEEEKKEEASNINLVKRLRLNDDNPEHIETGTKRPCFNGISNGEV